MSNGRDVAAGQNPVPLVNIKIGGTWVFIRPKMEAQVMTHGHVLSSIVAEGLGHTHTSLTWPSALSPKLDKRDCHAMCL